MMAIVHAAINANANRANTDQPRSLRGAACS